MNTSTQYSFSCKERKRPAEICVGHDEYGHYKFRQLAIGESGKDVFPARMHMCGAINSAIDIFSWNEKKYGWDVEGECTACDAHIKIGFISADK
jgi:hypothetical protein